MTFNRRDLLSIMTGSISATAVAAAVPAFARRQMRPLRTPVILCTDIGGDIDDTWALALLLKCPEIDLKLAVTEFGLSEYRGKLLAKFLERAGRDDIPVALGPPYPPSDALNASYTPQAPWVEGYELTRYRGGVRPDGARAIVQTIMDSPRIITVIDIGPMSTLAAALALEPRIASRARVVGMYGSIRNGNDWKGHPGPVVKEGNVVSAIKPAQLGLSAPWDITITPVDTCGQVLLDGERYQRLLQSTDPIVTALIENYRIWSRGRAYDSAIESSVLFDTVAIYLAFANDFCVMERLKIRVTDDGYTRIDPSGKLMNVATSWKDLDGFKDLLVNRLLTSHK